MSSSSVIQSQWQLNETADSAIAVAKGVLRAATSDNVQPLAIIAAEAFGATLAICRETQMKVEQAAKRHHTSYVAGFLKSSIGYAKDDCARQLSLSSTGVRFLGLAAALLCTADTFTASQALEISMKASASNKDILPTTTQLRDLLAALEHKLNRTGFAESVIGWETFLTEHPNLPNDLRVHSKLSIDHPGIQALQELIDGLRQLDRIGNTTSIQITAGSCAPWTIAFIKWCLGEVPNIVLEDGTVLISEPSARVVVVAVMKPMRMPFLRQDATPQLNTMLNQAREVDFEIRLFQDLESPAQLWTATGREQLPWHGMVPIHAFGRRRLRELGFYKHKAFYQAVAHAIEQTTSQLQVQHPLFHPPEADSLRMDRETNGPLPDALKKYKTRMFPHQSILKDTMDVFLDTKDTSGASLPKLGTGQDVLDLPLVGDYLTRLEKECKCVDCSGDVGNNLAECSKMQFVDSLSQVVAEIIALSLFDTLEPIYVYAGGMRLPGTKSLDRNGFVTAIWNMLHGRAAPVCSAAEILRFALDMIGHDVAAELGRRLWIASEDKGQVVFPQLFDACVLNSVSILTLGGAPGQLFHNTSKFRLVLGGTGRQWDTAAKSTCWKGTKVEKIINLIPEERIAWEVSAGDGVLYLACGSTNTPKVFNPHLILEALAQSVYIGGCPHSEDEALQKPDLHSFFITPLYSPAGHLWEEGSQFLPGNVGVVAVANNDGLRLLALACGDPGVVRGRACLACCLSLCRQSGMKYIVL